jgi:hypothetical protein
MKPFAALLIRALSILFAAASLHFFVGSLAVSRMYEGVIGSAKRMEASPVVREMIATLEIESIRAVHIYILTGAGLILIAAVVWILSKPLGRLLCIGLVDKDSSSAEKNA